MEIILNLNGKNIVASVEADTVLLDFLRDKGCLSVKRGCDTSNCGLCTVLMDGKPILSCSTLAVRADGHEIHTLEGLQEEAAVVVGLVKTGEGAAGLLGEADGLAQGLQNGSGLGMHQNVHTPDGVLPGT